MGRVGSGSEWFDRRTGRPWPGLWPVETMRAAVELVVRGDGPEPLAA